MKIEFIGATDEVTGSMTLVELPEGKILIDCGLHQGLSETIEKNKQPLPFPAEVIKAVFLTHAHLDHSGYLPKLVKSGFRGNIFCTVGTQKLAQIILKDSANIHDEISDQLYNSEDVNITISLFKPVEMGAWMTFLGATICFHPAGHILGAASVEIRSDKRLIFSGDLGRQNDPYMAPPENCSSQIDMVVMESTYGGKVRQGDMEKELYSFLVKISRQKKVGIIASFAVARGQLLINLIQEFFKRHPEEKIRVVMDGPMMNQANHVYQKYMPDKFSNLSEIEVIDNIGEWESLKKKSGPLIIISSSGMLSGGRIWRHLKNWQADPTAVLFLPGYQGVGTAGRVLAEGLRDIVAPDKERVQWSGEVITSEAFSSHADQSELLQWLQNVKKDTPIYLIHGEQVAKQAFKIKLNEIGYTNIFIPEKLGMVTL